MSHKPLQGRKELVVEYKRHSDQTYSNREQRSRYDQIQEAPSEGPSFWIPVDDFVESHDHPINDDAKHHTSYGNISIVFDLLKYVANARPLTCRSLW